MEVEEAIKFHDRYLKNGLSSCQTKPINYLTDELWVLLEEPSVLLPFEIQPIKIPCRDPSELVAGGYAIVPSSKDDEDQIVRLGTLSQIVAVGSAKIVLVQGLKRVYFKFTESLEKGKVVSEDMDTNPNPSEGINWINRLILRQLEIDNLKEDSYVTCSKKLLLSDDLRLKFFLTKSSFQRKLLSRAFLDLVEDQKIYCSVCYKQFNESTVLCKNFADYRSTISCINKSGNLFRIALIRDSWISLCNIGFHSGPFTDYSWFQDYAWSFAHCLRCGSFLGWKFTPTRKNLTGLPFWGIQTNLIKNSDKFSKYFD